MRLKNYFAPWMILVQFFYEPEHYSNSTKVMLFSKLYIPYVCHIMEISKTNLICACGYICYNFEYLLLVFECLFYSEFDFFYWKLDQLIQIKYYNDMRNFSHYHNSKISTSIYYHLFVMLHQQNSAYRPKQAEIPYNNNITTITNAKEKNIKVSRKSFLCNFFGYFSKYA